LGKSYTHLIEVKMDPHVKTTPEELAKQFELAEKNSRQLRGGWPRGE
jgi:hypothetical protein